MTSLGEFDLLSGQKSLENTQKDWKEVEIVRSMPNSFIEHQKKPIEYSKLNTSTSIGLFFTYNFYNLVYKYTNVNIRRKNIDRKKQIKTIKIEEIKNT